LTSSSWEKVVPSGEELHPNKNLERGLQVRVVTSNNQGVWEAWQVKLALCGVFLYLWPVLESLLHTPTFISNRKAPFYRLYTWFWFPHTILSAEG
jgi:hypothetical protein